MANILKRLMTRLSRKTPQISLSTQSVLDGSDPREQVLEEIRQAIKESGRISASQVRVACVLFFNVQVSSSFYTLRNFNKYGQYFEISSVKVEWSDNGRKIENIYFTFADTSFDSSVKITISVKDLTEWMMAVTPPLLDQPKSMV